jgi:hypothetical protein
MIFFLIFLLIIIFILNFHTHHLCIHFIFLQFILVMTTLRLINFFLVLKKKKFYF